MSTSVIGRYGAYLQSRWHGRPDQNINLLVGPWRAHLTPVGIWATRKSCNPARIITMQLSMEP